MNRLLRLLPVLALALALLSGRSAIAAGTTVTMKENAQANPQGHYVFAPATVTIHVGDTVTWNNTSDVPHTVTARDNSFDSGNLNPNATYSHTFKQAGTFSYYCRYHPGMVGKVIVLSATSSGNNGQNGGNGQSGGNNQQGGGNQQSGNGSPGVPSTGAGGMAHGESPLPFVLMGALLAALVGGITLRFVRARS